MCTENAPRHVESHNGAQETFSQGPSNIFAAPLWGENFFSKWRILVYFIFLSDGGAHQTLESPG